uniref:Zinc transporter ZIP2 (inferred by orthology to a human protein) n=1 Tax=Anisakis simplex TaxID=6269 RepID=A0A0M3JVV5_ANISI
LTVSMNVTGVKFILLGLMVVATFGCGLVPLRLLKLLRKSAALAPTSAKQRNVSLVLCLLTCFSGGVFLATCFLHLFPELQEHLSTMEEEYEFYVSYPIAELLSCCGFFLLFFLEELFLLLVPGMAHSHGPSSSVSIMHSERLPDRGDHEIGHTCEGKSKEVNTCNGNENTFELKVDNSDNATKFQGKDDDLSPKQGLLHSSNSTTSSRSNTPLQCNSSSHAECRRSRRDRVNFAEPEACETNCETVNEDPPILMKSMPHAHIHGVRSITFVLAISFHSVIEGLALGVQNDFTELLALFISLMVHKLIVAFSVGLQLGRTHAHALGWVCGSLLLLSLMSPLGGLIGMFVQNAQIDNKLKDFIILITQGLAVGTFIYVTFFEVLLHERDNEHPNLLKLAFMIVGFALIGAVRLFDTHSHEGSSSIGHAHSHQ